MAKVEARPPRANAYTCDDAPSVCCSGKAGVSHPVGTHKRMHDKTKAKLKGILTTPGAAFTYPIVRDKGVEAHNETFLNDQGKPLCKPDCLKAQIDAHMQERGTGAEIKVRRQDGATRAKYPKIKSTKKG
ncbi:HNH/endonuclease VII fold toxin-2 domain-containing protein [uncultured Lamprocystis sp.]|jgi:hypothetical protein|uniref:HNH/endonuclease VII fold toxin-2 domain-containing protein n=1 Tax=uncultured Lamprocystis sp. TaxID=543132 RepID=UPI0025D07269|nr:HNH/endonuclease VII fold toxin-2 domain-containing protein [uncultured Lamprocystis sp.]